MKKIETSKKILLVSYICAIILTIIVIIGQPLHLAMAIRST